MQLSLINSTQLDSIHNLHNSSKFRHLFFLLVSSGVWLTVDSALELRRTIASSIAPVKMNDMFENAEETLVYETVINLEGEMAEF